MPNTSIPALLLGATLFAGAASAVEASPPPVAAAIEEITRLTTVEWTHAGERGDATWFGRHFADELVITNGQTGELTTKAQEMTSVAPSQSVDSTSKIEDLRVTIYGDVAVALYEIDVSGTDKRGPWARTVHNTAVWVYRDGRWQLVTLHSTPLPPAHCCPHDGQPGADRP